MVPAGEVCRGVPEYAAAIAKGDGPAGDAFAGLMVDLPALDAGQKGVGEVLVGDIAAVKSHRIGDDADGSISWPGLLRNCIVARPQIAELVLAVRSGELAHSMGGILEGDIPAGKRRSCAIVLFVAADAQKLLVGEVDAVIVFAYQSNIDYSRGCIDIARFHDLGDLVEAWRQAKDTPAASISNGIRSRNVDGLASRQVLH